jgi:toxin CcdB
VRQFDVYASPSAQSASFAPFVLVLQSHYVELKSVVVAPLMTDKLPTSIDIAVSFQDTTYVLALTELASISASSLRQRVGDLSHREDDIRRALDRLFTGF